MTDSTPWLEGHLTFARITLASAIVLIAATLIPSIFSTDLYGAICICTVNYLAYAWIAFAIAAMISLIAQVSATTAMSGGCKCTKMFFPNLLMWLQAAALLSGIILMIVFIVQLLDVV